LTDEKPIGWHDHNITLWKHQVQMLEAPWRWPEIEYFFMPAGYGAGKSHTIAMLCLKIAKLYYAQPVTIILASTTIALANKTFVAILKRIMISAGIEFKHNENKNILSIGKVEFYIIPSEQPQDIFGINASAAIVDELDELPLDKAVSLVTAIKERTRVTFPRGKAPFMIYPTTAQGLKGLFAVVTDFQNKGIPHVIIRGKTKDNLVNDPRYITGLYKKYTDNEAKAYLEGEFVNLSEGRVYGEYDSEQHDVDRFEVMDDDIVYVGLDLNSGFSKAVAVVKRDRKLYVVKDFSFKSIGDVPRHLRNHFPSQEIILIPDASGKEIMAGYAKEIRMYRIKIKMAYVNPSITERIFIVNKLFRMGLAYLVKKDTKEYSLALKVRQFDETGKPSKGRGSKAPDHLCDSGDGAFYRIVGFDSDFKDIWDLAAPMRGNRTGDASLRIRSEEEIFTSQEV